MKKAINIILSIFILLSFAGMVYVVIIGNYKRALAGLGAWFLFSLILALQNGLFKKS